MLGYSDRANKFVTKLDLRTEITDEFDPENKFIVVCRSRTPRYIRFNREFAYIIPDFIFRLNNLGEYEMGEATINQSAMYMLEHEPKLLTKKNAENMVVSLLADGCEIITNPCMELDDARYFINIGTLKSC